MKVACARGCGFTVEVTPEALKEMVDLGQDIVVNHEVCPTEAGAPMRKFRITTEVFELMETGNEKVAGMGDTVEAANFTLALKQLGEALQQQWATIMGLSDTIDAPEADPYDGASGQDRKSYTDDQDRESYTAVWPEVNRCRGCGVSEQASVLRQLGGYHSSECARDHAEEAGNSD